MRKALQLTSLLAASLALGGCVASLAASALGAAARSGQKPYQHSEALQLAATQACRAHAAQHGEVHIIDWEQRGSGKVVVYGTATNGANRRSFECTYTNKVVGFRLRAIGG
ncbi:hypothetical protein [uncultured Sphingomonas sp.]|uniref:hypothetical protein n=1 Tax=uncultured Sphingomonas sp. TaxID=158754 RepID=UPI0025CEF62A|nr:hypothetical protein [uncultured Sphingomonas sp.]